MRVLVAANVTPYLRGGADYHIEGLTQAIRSHGHETELIRLPFVFQPEADIRRAMAFCDGFDLAWPNGMIVDRLISLQFPAFGLHHPQHVAWVMHQHRAAYELYDETQASPEQRQLREEIIAFDNRTLGGIQRRFANSHRVAERLKQYNNLDATPLYHPPTGAERFYCRPAEPYVFYPSRFETLKRQHLLIEAARLMKSPLSIVLAGEGWRLEQCRKLVEQYGLQHKVRFVGRVSEEEKYAFYAHALAVYFGPYDEDLGYITLEAMLSSKPVITCRDSGGPLEFVRHGETGWVVDPDPAEIAECLDALYPQQRRAVEMGQASRERYESLNISWDNVVSRLLTLE